MKTHKFKAYQCKRCGYEREIKTNHYGECYSFGAYNRCPICPISKPTIWTCTEEPPAGEAVAKPWKVAFLFLFFLITHFTTAMANDWDGIVVHITDSDHMTLEECNDWHRQRGWDMCGYNFVIDEQGGLYEARGFDRVGAHVKGYNFRYLGIAFVRKDGQFATDGQLETFRAFLSQYNLGPLPLYPHFKFTDKKTCPSVVWGQLQKYLTKDA